MATRPARIIGKRRNWNTNPAVFRELASGIDERMLKALTRIAEQIVKTAQTILITSDHVATGTLVDSFVIKPRKNGTQPYVLVANTAKWALVMEFGRRPGMKAPPPDAIRLWLRRKGKPTDEATIYLVGRGIQKNGIDGIRYMSRALAQNAFRFNLEIQTEFDDFVRATIRKTKVEEPPKDGG